MEIEREPYTITHW